MFSPLVAAAALRPLVEELDELRLWMAELPWDENDGGAPQRLMADIGDALALGNDEGRMKAYRAQARILLGLDPPLPGYGLRGVMMGPEEAAMRELLAERPVPQLAQKRKPRPVPVHRVMECAIHGRQEVTDTGLVAKHRFRCCRCDAFLQEVTT